MSATRKHPGTRIAATHVPLKQQGRLVTMEMTITEAATRLSVSADTIRRRIRRGELSARQAPRPQGHVWMVELEDDQEPQENHHDDSVLVEILRQQLTEKDHQLDARTREISELHQLLAARALEGPRNRPWWAFWRW